MGALFVTEGAGGVVAACFLVTGISCGVRPRGVNAECQESRSLSYFAPRLQANISANTKRDSCVKRGPNLQITCTTFPPSLPVYLMNGLALFEDVSLDVAFLRKNV